MKFLVDECLSEELAKLAVRRGHPESSHVNWIGKRGWKDWHLKAVILDGDWTFVTKNSSDFRGRKARRGSGGQYAEMKVHAGLVCLNGPVGMDLDLQFELFDAALNALSDNDDLINQVLEITTTGRGDGIELLRYRLPAD